MEENEDSWWKENRCRIECRLGTCITIQTNGGLNVKKRAAGKLAGSRRQIASHGM